MSVEHGGHDHDLRVAIATALIRAGIDSDTALFEWHPCCDHEGCGWVSGTTGCACSGRPYLSEPAWRAIGGAYAMVSIMYGDRSDDRPWRHGTKLGREHVSLRHHLVEDHGLTVDEVTGLSAGAAHGLHDGQHGRTWAHALDLPHGASPGCAPGCDYPVSGHHARRGGYPACYLPGVVDRSGDAVVALAVRPDTQPNGQKE